MCIACIYASIGMCTQNTHTHTHSSHPCSKPDFADLASWRYNTSGKSNVLMQKAKGPPTDDPLAHLPKFPDLSESDSEDEPPPKVEQDEMEEYGEGHVPQSGSSRAQDKGTMALVGVTVVSCCFFLCSQLDTVSSERPTVSSSACGGIVWCLYSHNTTHCPLPPNSHSCLVCHTLCSLHFR